MQGTNHEVTNKEVVEFIQYVKRLLGVLCVGSLTLISGIGGWSMNTLIDVSDDMIAVKTIVKEIKEDQGKLATKEAMQALEKRIEANERDIDSLR